MRLNLGARLVLASASPRRIKLLKLMGLDVEVIPSCVNEATHQDETPEQHVMRLSAEKANAIAGCRPEAWVIGADTIVFLEGEFFGKPASLADAKKMLMRLSGREHFVYTGFTIVQRGKNILSWGVVKTSVFFKHVTEDEINWYIMTEEPYDKAGGYAVQGIGAFFIKELHGSYTNVIGLPLCELISMLTQLGALSFHGGNSDIVHTF